MQRRVFLKSGTALALAAPALAAPAIAQSAPEIKWRLTSSFPKSLDAIYGGGQMLCRYIADATDGKFQIQSFAAGELVPGLQALDAVTSGSVECAHTPTAFYIAKEPTLGFGTGLPFGFNNRHQQAWWAFGGGEEIVNAALRKLNVLAIPAGNSGTQMGGWFRKEINTVEDLKGLRFRISGMGGEVLAKLGVVPQKIPAGDVYPALERGTIDAAEFVGPHDDEKLGLSKIAKFYYYPCWWEGSAMLHFLVNLEKWEALPKSYRAVVAQACEAANTWMLAKYDWVNAAALRRLLAGGTLLRPFPHAVLQSSYQAAQELYAEIAAKNHAFKKALDSVNAFRNEQLPWWQIAEHAFDSLMLDLRNKAG